MCGSGDVIVGASLTSATVTSWLVLPPSPSCEVTASVFATSVTLPVGVLTGVGVTGGMV
jgi:hypothetical protein